MFQQVHRIATGEQMLVAQMTDEHLLNMLETVVSWAEKATAEFRAAIEQIEEEEAQVAFSSKPYAEAQRQIYGLLPPPDIAETTARYATAIAQFSGRIEPYLMEAWTRRFDGDDDETFDALRTRWQQAVGRSWALPNPRESLLIPSLRLPRKQRPTYTARDDAPVHDVDSPF
jgi:hypothetical protein